MVWAPFASGCALGTEYEGTDTNIYHHEHEDGHHLNRLVYYCLTIVPVLALLIILPNTCYSMICPRRDERGGKMD